MPILPRMRNRKEPVGWKVKTARGMGADDPKCLKNRHIFISFLPGECYFDTKV
jgi:hypothetical protein